MNTPTSRFQIGETDFLLDGMPHRIISGAMHYPGCTPTSGATASGRRGSWA